MIIKRKLRINKKKGGNIQELENYIADNNNITEDRLVQIGDESLEDIILVLSSLNTSQSYNNIKILRLLQIVFEKDIEKFKIICENTLCKTIVRDKIYVFIDLYNKKFNEYETKYKDISVREYTMQIIRRYNYLRLILKELYTNSKFSEYIYLKFPRLLSLKTFISNIGEDIQLYAKDKIDKLNFVGIPNILINYIHDIEERNYLFNEEEYLSLLQQAFQKMNGDQFDIDVIILNNDLFKKTITKLLTTESSRGGSLNQYLRYKTKDGRQIKKKIYIINGKPKVRDGKNKKKEINYVSLSTYKKKYS